MDTYSINPVSIIDEAIDLSTRLSGTAFPVSIFPNKIQRIIREVHECHNYPTDYIAAAILTAIAVGIGNTHLAQIKQGWTEKDCRADIRGDACQYAERCPPQA